MNATTIKRALMLSAMLGASLAGFASAWADEPAKAPEAKSDPNVKLAPGVRQLTAEEVEKMKKAEHGANTAGQPANSELPKALELSETQFDWGNVSDAEAITHEFKVKNITDRSIKITVAASCGCTIGKLEKDVLGPGESSPVSATFNPQGRNGPQTKTLTITVIDPQGVYAQQTNTLTANVKAMVSIEPQKVFVNEVDHREGKTDKLIVIGRHPGFKVEKVESTSAFVKATVGNTEEAEENGEKITRVAINLDIGKDAPIGSLSSQLSIHTNAPGGKPVQTFVGADVIGDIRATPPSTMIRANAPGAIISAEMKLDTRSGKPFRITNIEIEGKPEMKLVSDFASAEGGAGYMVKLSGVAPEQPGLVQGAVTIATDSLGGETIRVPFTLTVPRNLPKPAAAPAAPAADAVLKPTQAPTPAPTPNH